MLRKLIPVLIVIIILAPACMPGTQTPVASEIPQPTKTVAVPTIQSTSTPQPTPGDATPVPTIAFTASDPAVCKPAPILPEFSAEFDARFPSPGENDWILGPEDAPVTLYVYSDFQCPFCARVAPALKELQVKYPKDVRLVFRHFPQINEHPNATLASQASEAAGLQKKFWPMHDLLFEKQAEWSALSTDEFKTWLKEKARSLNLNSNQFMVDLDSEAIVQKVVTSQENALASNISGVPSLLVNKIPFDGRSDLETLSSIVEYFLLPEKSYTECPEFAIDPEKTYTVTIKTQKGDIVLELYPKQAPVAVNSIVFLIRNNWFTGTSFYRVIPNFVAQTGDPSNSSLGGPGFEYTNEVSPELRFDKPGVVGLANTGNNDNGSQFFITYQALPNLDGKYTIFGQVISGMEVLYSLRPRNPASDEILVPPDAILSITVEEK